MAFLPDKEYRGTGNYLAIPFPRLSLRVALPMIWLSLDAQFGHIHVRYEPEDCR